MTMVLVMTQIINNFLVNVTLSIAVVISLEVKVAGELIKNSKKIQELVDNFFKV